MADSDLAVIDTSLRYDKRAKAVHRTIVNGSHGPVLLTVPVSAHGARTWDRVRISSHDEWYRQQRATLDTLFGPTPWYSVMRTDLLPHIDVSAVGRPITDLDVDLILAIRELSHITTPLSVTLDDRHLTPADTVTDLRRHDWYAEPDTRSCLQDLFTTGSLAE